MARSPERVAYERGIKPALRLAVRAGEAAGVVERERAAGHAAVASASVEGRAFVYVARAVGDAERLRDLEAPYLPGSPARRADATMRDAHRALGLGLGYPACCVESFVERLARDVRRARDGSLAHEDFVAVEDALARSAAQHALLCATPLDRGTTIVSFYACRLDCPAALSIARAIAQAFAAADPDAHPARRDALCTPLAITREGERVPPAGAPRDAIVLDAWERW